MSRRGCSHWTLVVPAEQKRFHVTPPISVALSHPPSATFRRDWHTRHLAETVSAEDTSRLLTSYAGAVGRKWTMGWPRGNMWLAVGRQSCLRLLQDSGCKALATGLPAGSSLSSRGLFGRGWGGGTGRSRASWVRGNGCRSQNRG